VQAYQAAGFGRFQVEQAQWPIGRVTVRATDAIEAWMMQRHGQQTLAPVCEYSAGVLVGFVNVLSDRRDVACIERRCQAVGDDACVFELLPAAEARGRNVIAFTPDPALGRDPTPPPTFSDARLRETLARLAASESLLRSVIENARHFAIYRVQVDPDNPYHGRVVLTSPSLRDLSGIEDIYDFSAWFANLHPEDAPRIVEANRRALDDGAAYNQVARHRLPAERRHGRRAEVLALMAQGLNNKEIAERLVVSVSTAKFHVSSILSKLGAATRTKAVALALQNRLVT